MKFSLVRQLSLVANFHVFQCLLFQLFFLAESIHRNPKRKKNIFKKKNRLVALRYFRTTMFGTRRSMFCSPHPVGIRRREPILDSTGPIISPKVRRIKYISQIIELSWLIYITYHLDASFLRPFNDIWWEFHIDDFSQFFRNGRLARKLDEQWFVSICAVTFWLKIAKVFW